MQREKVVYVGLDTLQAIAKALGCTVDMVEQ